MTTTIDRFWIARGVDANELSSLKGRSFLYVGLMSMAVTASVLVAGIIVNVTAPIA